MPKINIITPFGSNQFDRQFPTSLSAFEIWENGDSSINYDLIVIYEGLRGPVRVKCADSNVLFISGEPPMSRVYSDGFLRQFKYVVSCHPNLMNCQSIQYQQSLPWHFGRKFGSGEFVYDYADLIQMAMPRKTKRMSIVSSGKTMMPGHLSRLKFVDELKSVFKNDIDFFGRDTRPIEDKSEAILPYFMTICLENSHIPNYWTEKLADAYLGYSLPIYNGCSNITDYFPEKSLIRIDLEDRDKTIGLIGYLLDNCEQVYNERQQPIVQARDLILHKYNLYYYLIEFYHTHIRGVDSSYFSTDILPNTAFPDFRRKYLKLRLKRFVSKYLS